MGYAERRSIIVQIGGDLDILKGEQEMIKLEHMVLASPEQMKFVIEGMRNPMNSWNKTDSELCKGASELCDRCIYNPGRDNPCYLAIKNKENYLVVGSDDFSLMNQLSIAGTDHRKFMRMLPVYVRITAPLYWWKEFDTYKVGTVANSCSTMHKIQAKEFTLDDFSCEHLMNVPGEGVLPPLAVLKTTIDTLNAYRNLYLGTLSPDGSIGIPENRKDIWWQMIQLLPSSYNQTRNVMMNYEVLANIYKSRKDHKLDEWRSFCKWIEELPYSELITGGKR